MSTSEKLQDQGTTLALSGRRAAQRQVGVWALLVLLTGLTVGVTFLDLKKFVVVSALLIATGKASLVLLYFMHLRFESRLLGTVVLVAVAALVIFLLLMFSDLVYRYG